MPLYARMLSDYSMMSQKPCDAELSIYLYYVNVDIFSGGLRHPALCGRPRYGCISFMLNVKG